MTNSPVLTVFISWSGDVSKHVAVVWERLVNEMFDHVKPWMSEVSIEPGTRGLDEIRKTLKETSFGIIIVTRSNENAPWINFEAGALSKALNDDDSRVAPVLVDYNNPAELSSPLKQFQGKLLNKDGVEKVLKLVADTAGIEWSRVKPRFDRSWGDYEKEFEEARTSLSSQQVPQDIDTSAMIPEILETVRDLKRDRTRSIERFTPDELRWMKYGREAEEGPIADQILAIMSIHGVSGARVSFNYVNDRRVIQIHRLADVSDEVVQRIKAEILATFSGAMLSIGRLTAVVEVDE
ncbi:TIR domain-containing protein [Rhodococcus sp. NPDC057014]|uniref:TIR domain-containing protein n=1 Tax=Rhodococcus sp. NPDC057014 TaxID=3346000 RepID=UPI00363C5095